jgi:hypothetical protein
MSRTSLVSLILAFALGSSAHAQTDKPFSVRVEANAIVASEVTHGGSAVFFGVAFDVQNHVRTRVDTAVIVRDEDGDGMVRHEVPEGLPRIGIWGVVDFTTGAVGIVSRPSRGVRPLDDAVGASFRSDDAGAHFVRFERQIGSAALLVVRPGREAWTISATEGGHGDDDYPMNGNLVIPPNRLVPLTPGGGAPEHLLPGDVVLLIDTGEMRAGTAALSGRN